MIVFLVGPPSTFFTRCSQLVKATLETVYRPVTERACHTIDALNLKDGAPGPGQAQIMHVHSPDEEVRRKLSSTRPPTIFVLDEWRSVLAHHSQTTGADYRASARYISMYYAATHDIVTRAGGILLEPSPSMSVKTAGLVTSAYLGFKSNVTLEETGFRSVLAEAKARVESPLVQLSGPGAATKDAPSTVDEADAASVLAFCRAFEELHKRKPVSKFLLQISMFEENTGVATRRASRWITATGPARIMIFGPYIYLPAGDWSARGVIRVKDLHGGNDLLVEVYNAIDQAKAGPAFSATISLPANGNLQVQFDFTVTDPLAPLDLRLVLLRGAIEGKFDLEQLELSRRVKSRQRAAAKSA